MGSAVSNMTLSKHSTQKISDMIHKGRKIGIALNHRLKGVRHLQIHTTKKEASEASHSICVETEYYRHGLSQERRVTFRQASPS